MKIPKTSLAALLGAYQASSAMVSSCSDILRPGAPESVGVLSQPLRDMVANMSRFTEARNWGAPTHNQVLPVEPGGSVLVARHGRIVSHFAFGKRNLWASVDGYNGSLLPKSDQEDSTTDTIYDLASLTKLFTTVAVLRCLDAGLVTLNGTVVTWLPRFGANGKESVTLLQLLTHTSGFDADPAIGLWTPRFPTYESRIDDILATKLINEPGAAYLYSDLNFMTLMLVVEAVTGKRHDEVILEFTSAMGMTDTYFNRDNVEGAASPRYHRVAAQEFQEAVSSVYEPPRPQPVRGTVHDENAWSLVGVAGHAGLFSTALDTAKLGQMILNNGTYGGVRVLSRASVELIFTNFNARFGPRNAHGAGFELDQAYTAGPMANIQAASHTGFTGTSLVVDRASGTVFVHLANRVHPSRYWSSNNVARQTLGAWVATALGRTVQFP
ncbi:Beta-lactamase/transpeptidase-like protein [Cordyceps fumosorosea ARSEF 2679]|uniref:Beta-lactamase/transpeptidase-like protein n=1 Tax=Cordyceps fumosorosea (strain ARSEF 2679) TaxID=1081104 RepID=A0A167Q4P3_CORFA|nr:Beta-lactamase/transpeptidase-like protein [Cordyceps fumosorosea ARSEF 2679]OAA57285.1 Beta-lactamase/transpeptidase-like protein [Cordyceps fumosorosea ARSEF 2679]